MQFHWDHGCCVLVMSLTWNRNTTSRLERSRMIGPMSVSLQKSSSCGTKPQLNHAGGMWVGWPTIPGQPLTDGSHLTFIDLRFDILSVLHDIFHSRYAYFSVSTFGTFASNIESNALHGLQGHLGSTPSRSVKTDSGARLTRQYRLIA